MKRTCQDCEERFYDLARLPVTCPMCGVDQSEMPPPFRFDPSVAPPKAARWRAPDRPKVAEIVEPEAEAEEAEVDDDDDADDVGVADAIVDEGFLEDTGEEGVVTPVASEDEAPDT